MKKEITAEEHKLGEEVVELLNQILIKLDKVQEPEIRGETRRDYYDDDGGYSRLGVSFKDYNAPKLGSVKIVVDALLKDIQSQESYSRDAEKMARAYYSSFCNG